VAFPALIHPFGLAQPPLVTALDESWRRHQDGWVLSRNGAPFAATTIEVEGDKVRKVFVTLNPDKLAHVKAPQGASS
jgi:hypothetical protein